MLNDKVKQLNMYEEQYIELKSYNTDIEKKLCASRKDKNDSENIIKNYETKTSELNCKLADLENDSMKIKHLESDLVKKNEEIEDTLKNMNDLKNNFENWKIEKNNDTEVRSLSEDIDRLYKDNDRLKEEIKNRIDKKIYNELECQYENMQNHYEDLKQQEINLHDTYKNLCKQKCDLEKTVNNMEVEISD